MVQITPITCTERLEFHQNANLPRRKRPTKIKISRIGDIYADYPKVSSKKIQLILSRIVILKKKLPPLFSQFPWKVGEIKEEIVRKNPKTGKINRKSIHYSYNDFEYDIDGWADCKKYLPLDFDLVFLRLEREKTLPGWLNGSLWEGLRLIPEDKVLFWKRKNEEDVS